MMVILLYRSLAKCLWILYNTMDFFNNLFKGKSDVEKAQKKLDDIKGKCKVDTEVAEKVLTEAKLNQAPADAAVADIKPMTTDNVNPSVGGKKRRVRFSKKCKGGKNKKRVKTNKKRR